MQNSSAQGFTRSSARTRSSAARALDSALGRALRWAALMLGAAAALVFVIIPFWLIRPFKPQTAGGIELSYLLRRWSPSLTLVFAVAVMVLAVWLWRGSRWWLKPLLIVAVVVAGVASWFARQNHFEWMFNPLVNTAYARAADSNFLSDSDMVIAVDIGGEAASYPIRQMAYHHVVQDTVGGTPLIATY